MKSLGKIALFAVLGLLLLAAAIQFRSCAPGGDGVIAQLERPDGTAYRVTQEWNDWTEPYTVRFFLRNPEGKWGWCYIDHQSERWRSAKLTFEESENRVLLTEAGQVRGELLLSKHEFSLFDSEGRWRWTRNAPEEWEDPKF